MASEIWCGALYSVKDILFPFFFPPSQYSSWCYINVWLSQVTEHRSSILTIQEVPFFSLIFCLHTWKMRFYEDATSDLDMNQKVNKTKTLRGDDSFRQILVNITVGSGVLVFCAGITFWAITLEVRLRLLPGRRCLKIFMIHILKIPLERFVEAAII